MTFRLETEREVDGRWIADFPDLPGVMSYGATEEDAVQAVWVLALQVIADKILHGELRATRPDGIDLPLQAAGV